MIDGVNYLIDRYFYVIIGSLDRVFFKVISKGVILIEGGRVVFIIDLFSISDINSFDE